MEDKLEMIIQNAGGKGNMMKITRGKPFTWITNDE